MQFSPLATLLFAAACANCRGPIAADVAPAPAQAKIAPATQQSASPSMMDSPVTSTPASSPPDERASEQTYAESRTSMQGTVPPSWLPWDTEHGPCNMDKNGHLNKDKGSDVGFENGRSAHGPFTVTSKGPSGSGRYWEVGVTFPSRDGIRGFCFTTTSVGWRHVGSNHSLAAKLGKLVLEWTNDVDGDGQQELVVRSSFPLSESEGLSEWAMSAAVYDRVKNSFVYNRERSHGLNLKIADAYRSAAKAARGDRHYLDAAKSLEKDSY